MGFSVAAIHDRDIARRDALCRDLGAASLGSTGDLAEAGCQAAIVCSETAHHEADITAALAAGLPVFSEKPLAGSAAAAQRCAEMAERTGLMLHTGYFMRSNAGLAALRARLRDGAIGEVIEARMRFSHDGGLADWLDLDCWMTRPELACYGGFVDEAVHCIDALRWMLGPCEAAGAMTGNHLGWAVDDHGAAFLRFDSGATGVVQAGWTDSEMRLELDLVGSTGHATLQDGRIAIHRRGASEPDWTATLSPLDAGEGVRPFLNALQGKEADALVPPQEATRVNEIIDALGLRYQT